MIRSILAFALLVFPIALFAQTGSDSAPNCKWAAMKGITPDLSVNDFLDTSITGDWMNYTKSGVIIVPSKNFSYPIPQVPPEVITILESNNRYYVRNMSGDAEIEIREFLGGEPAWVFDGAAYGGPFGEAGKDGAVIDLGLIEFQSGCELADLPLLIGTGTWKSAKGHMDVELYLIPVGENDLHVVMEGTGHSAEGAFIVRRGYSMHRLEAEPLTE